MSAKIVKAGELQAISAKLRAAGKKLVVTNGCFDLLHAGHVRYLQAARQLGDILAVGINSDASTRSLKGEGRPINCESERAEVLAALACVDYVTIFREVRATRFLIAASPAVYAKGGDYTADTLDAEERAAIKKVGAEIRILPLESGYSTSALIERIRQSCAT